MKVDGLCFRQKDKRTVKEGQKAKRQKDSKKETETRETKGQ